jgi:hypothetical protein
MSDSKMLERVRALLAKAADPSIEQAESDAFRQKADELMTKHTIDQWMVDQAETGRHAAVMPEKRMVDFSWYRGNPFRSNLWWLLQTVARHCRCRAVSRTADYTNLKIGVYGLPNDLDWFDQLFTSLMLQMMQKVDPQPSKDLTLNENLAMMREAGMQWEPAINRIIKLGETSDFYIDPDDTFEKVYKPWVHGYRRWCRNTGHPQSYVNQQTYRTHFADGFADGITSRLREIRLATQSAYDSDHEAGGMALAVRSIEDIIQEMIWDEFPDMRPHPADCQCEVCHIRKCRDPNCKRTACVAARKPVKASRARTARMPKIDWAAREAGVAAGRAANIENAPSRRVGNKKELGS